MLHRIFAATLLAAVLNAPAGLAEAQVRQPGPEQQIPDDQEVVRGPVARFSWAMKDRYRDGWRAWSARTARYDRSYVRPGSWTITVNACNSSGFGRPIERYRFKIDAVGSDFSTAAAGPACRRRFRDLPKLGSYDVRVAVSTDGDTSAAARKRVTLTDHLIVSIGDSMASGEGNPDRRGRYKLGVRPKGSRMLRAVLTRSWEWVAKQLEIVQLRPVRWRDKRCHRSALAGHAQAARKLEDDDPHSSVTFISLACSGAQIRHLLTDRYAGQQPPGRRTRDNRRGSRDNRSPHPATVPPQLRELARLVGARAIRSRGRRVDALLLSIGINDLDFSGIIKACASNFVADNEGSSDCIYDTGVTRKLEKKLGPRYDELGTALRRRLNVSEVYVTDYPAAPFGDDDGANGLLGLPTIGITGIEAGAMYSVGLRFAEEIRRAAARNGWNYVPGMSARFAGHDYRKSDSYLRRLEESFSMQGTVHGAVHPNEPGHRVLAGLLTRSVVLGRGPVPDFRARIEVEQVRVPAAAGEVRFNLHDPSAEFPAERRFDLGGVAGEWVEVPDGQVVFEVDLCRRPAPPRCATLVDLVMTAPGGTVPMTHGAGDGYGAGAQEATGPKGHGVRYRIELRRFGDPLSPPNAPAAGG